MSIPAFSPSYTTHSLYRYTPIVGRFMDFYVHRSIPSHPLDTIQIIKSSKYDKRPDNFAFDYYGDASLFWIIGVRNGLKDLYFDFVMGGSYYVPAPSYIQELMS